MLIWMQTADDTSVFTMNAKGTPFYMSPEAVQFISDGSSSSNRYKVRFLLF